MAAFDLSQQAGKHMRPRGRGRIINVGSVMCYEAGLNIPAYAAAKHVIAGLTKSLAVSWSGKGIVVNCIAPGYFETDRAPVLKNDPVRGPEILDRIPRAGGAGRRNWRGCACSWRRTRASTCMAVLSWSTAGGWRGETRRPHCHEHAVRAGAAIRSRKGVVRSGSPVQYHLVLSTTLRSGSPWTNRPTLSSSACRCRPAMWGEYPATCGVRITAPASATAGVRTAGVRSRTRPAPRPRARPPPAPRPDRPARRSPRGRR